MPKKPLTNTEIQKRLDALERKGMAEGGTALNDQQSKKYASLAADDYVQKVADNPSAYGFSDFATAKTALDTKYPGGVGAGLTQEFLNKGTFTTNASGGFESLNFNGTKVLGITDDKKSTSSGTDGLENDVAVSDMFGKLTGSGGPNPFDPPADEDVMHYYVTQGGAVRSVVAGEMIPWANQIASGPYLTQEAANEALAAYMLTDEYKNRGSRNDDGTGDGTGTGTDDRFGDVQNEVAYQAGLTGVDAVLKPGEQVTPTKQNVQAGELETSVGTQVTSDVTADATQITAEQMKKLEVQGYTDPASANTVEATIKATEDAGKLALSAASTNALTGAATGAVGALSNSAVANLGPQTDSIAIKKADGTFETPGLEGVTASNIPSANLVQTDYNVATAAAKRDIQAEELATAATLGQNVAQSEAQIQSELNNKALMQAQQTTAAEEAGLPATAAEQAMADVPLEATVQGQLTNLMSQFAGGKTPAFAAAAIRNAEATMAARGLSASSMAGAAIMQAAMESAIPVAAQDAQMFAQINLTNLSNKQQVALANQASAQNIVLSNLTNRQQAALSNSTNAFKLQSDSLSNMQQASLANAQLKAAVQGQELTNKQQTNLTNAARYAEINGINLNNEQQTSLANSAANTQVALTNLSNGQQTALANAQVEAAIRGQELTNAQQAAVINASRIGEINNLKFTEEQQRNLNTSKIMENMTLTNMDAEMKVALQNAATYANMDLTNLNNKQQALVQNAQSFLQLDMANLTNKQQGEVLKFQAKTQALFSDQAADNARLQFNAQSENQVEQFFAQLGSQTSQQNANRVRGMLEFNVNEENAIAKFNSSLSDSREKFNSSMVKEINQSNATWRRQLNTQNTATQNEANRVNALNTLQVGQSGLNKIWQQYRDEASWLQQNEFNIDQYVHELAKIALTGDVNRALFNAEVKDDAWSAIGGRVADWIFKDRSKKGE